VALLSSAVIVPTFRRNHFLWACLRRIRVQDQDIPIYVFSDRGEDSEELREVCKTFDALLRITPVHDYYGNSYNVMESLRWAYDQNIELTIVNEDDFMQSDDCLDWYRKVHDLFDDIFCACGWVFNQQAPISDDLMFAPWFYSPGYSVKREKLAKIVKHANPLYYNSMRAYVLEHFPDSILHGKGAQNRTMFLEQDAVWQYCIEADKSQVAWNGIAKGAHLGAVGYNRPKGPVFTGSLMERIAQVEGLISDPYWRAELFTRNVVEREIGHPLPRRTFRYRLNLPGGWKTDVETEVTKEHLPRRIHSAPLPEGTEISVVQG
jgi:hypothetical protein